jgi:serine/threonine-protein kinase
VSASAPQEHGHSDPTVPELRVGRTLGGKWKVERMLGSGGVASVYAALDASGAKVALKVMHPELVAEPTVRARFLREATLAGSIEHRGIVRVAGDGTTEDGAPFLVMELLDGETLEERMQRKGGKLPVREVLWIADELLDVLAAAHAMGIVHRDIKPPNLFLTSDHALKVLDFGIARVRRHAEAEAAMTAAGSVLGSLGFMPPEQARGDVDEIGVQSDLWAVGATMFTLLTGDLVHHGETLEQLLRAATRLEPPKLATVAPDLPPAVCELVDLALSFELKERWRDARTMQNAVREVAEIVRAGASGHAARSAPFSDAPLVMPRKLHSVEPPPMSLKDRGSVKIPKQSRVPSDLGPTRLEDIGDGPTPWGMIALGVVLAAAIGAALAWAVR